MKILRGLTFPKTHRPWRRQLLPTTPTPLLRSWAPTVLLDKMICRPAEANIPLLSERPSPKSYFYGRRGQAKINTLSHREPFGTAEGSELVKHMLKTKLKAKNKLKANIQDESQKTRFYDDTREVTASQPHLSKNERPSKYYHCWR